ncbi:MAG: NAD-binding protein [Oscillochloridaceae bacterium umkhey_bin13]
MHILHIQANLPPRPTSSEDEIRLERLRQKRRRYPLWRLLRANLRDIRQLGRQAGVSLLLLAILLLSSAFYLQLVYFPELCGSLGERCGPDGDLVAAFHATLLLLVFEEPVPLPHDPAGRLIFLAVPLLGLFFVLQSVVDFARLLFDKSARREGWQISLASTFSDHVIVCGMGRVGYRVVLQLLDAGYEVVAVDIDGTTEFAPIIRRLKVPLVVGDGRDPDVLGSAGVTRARSLIAVISEDLPNIEIALTARRRRPSLQTVVRIISPELDQNIEVSFGRNAAFSSSDLAAPTFAAATLSRSIVHVLDLPSGLLALAELTITANSPLATLSTTLEQQYAVRIIRWRDQQGRERPQHQLAQLAVGDVVMLLGTLPALEQVHHANQSLTKRNFLSPSPLPQTLPAPLDRVIICGLGKVGAQVIRLLLAQEPHPKLVAICREDTPAKLHNELSAAGVDFVYGDARDPAVLLAAGIERAYAVAAIVSDDLSNLQVGLVARSLRPDLHLVLRVFSDVLAERLDDLFGINTAYSTSALAAPTLAAAAVQPGIDHAFDVGERLFASQTLVLGPGDILVGQSIAQIRQQRELLVVALRRAAQTALIPTNDTVLATGDEVALLGELRALARLQRGPHS